MGRLTWNLLRQVAWNWSWAWRHLVPEGRRVEWARIAAAMSASTLHVVDWAEVDGSPMPAWVPCRPCGGGPCRNDPTAIQGDVYVARLERILTASTEEQHDGTPTERSRD